MRIVASAQDDGPNYSCDCFCTAEEHLSASSFHEFLHGLYWQDWSRSAGNSRKKQHLEGDQLEWQQHKLEFMSKNHWNDETCVVKIRFRHLIIGNSLLGARQHEMSFLTSKFSLCLRTKTPQFVDYFRRRAKLAFSFIWTKEKWNKELRRRSLLWRFQWW